MCWCGWGDLPHAHTLVTILYKLVVPTHSWAIQAIATVHAPAAYGSPTAVWVSGCMCCSKLRGQRQHVVKTFAPIVCCCLFSHDGIYVQSSAGIYTKHALCCGCPIAITQHVYDMQLCAGNNALCVCKSIVCAVCILVSICPNSSRGVIIVIITIVDLLRLGHMHGLVIDVTIGDL